MRRLALGGMALLVAVGGCSPEAATPQPAPIVPVVIGARFDATATGRIVGRVTWSGAVPDVPPFEIRNLVTEWSPPQPRALRPNPNAPAVTAETGGIADAVVFLRGVDPQRSRPWDHSHLTVEHSDRQLVVIQGERRGRIGFARLGDTVTMVSREKLFNSLHADGAAYFTLTFPDPDQPLTRPLASKGRVELSSAAGYYWMRGHLFVDDHPYYTRTDRAGLFELLQVPPGRYEIVCWLPNWNVARTDRDPESGLVTRLAYQPPLEVLKEVVVESGGEARVDYGITAEQFRR
jgi:hypothetical protein